MQIKFQNNVTGEEEIVECKKVSFRTTQTHDGRFFTFDFFDNRLSHVGSTILGETGSYTIYIENENGKTVDTLQWQPQMMNAPCAGPEPSLGAHSG